MSKFIDAHKVMNRFLDLLLSELFWQHNPTSINREKLGKYSLSFEEAKKCAVKLSEEGLIKLVAPSLPVPTEIIYGAGLGFFLESLNVTVLDDKQLKEYAASLRQSEPVQPNVKNMVELIGDKLSLPDCRPITFKGRILKTVTYFYSADDRHKWKTGKMAGLEYGITSKQLGDDVERINKRVNKNTGGKVPVLIKWRPTGDGATSPKEYRWAL